MTTRGEAPLSATSQAARSPADERGAMCHTPGGGAAGAGAGSRARIAGRYRLDDQVGETGHSTLWKAFDDALGRPVTMRTFAPGFARGAEVVAAARAACQVRDERMERVFDAEEATGCVYIVSEWPSGESLDDILATGPVDIRWAAQFIAQAASALAVAHAAGTAHLCLTPRSLRWSPDGGLKITGLGIEAALAEHPSSESVPGGSGPADPARADTRALARLLYAALTGYWPGPQPAPLPSAPQRDGCPYRPRQIRAGVPARIDDITCRALFDSVACGGRPVSTPGELAELLEAALRDDAGHAAKAARPDDAAAVPGWDATSTSGRVLGRRHRHALAGGLVGALFVIDSALIGISVIGAGGAPHVANIVTRGPAPRHVVARPHQPTRLLTPISAQAFDPFGGGADENNQLASAAIDQNPATAWHTCWYTTEHFGNLKPGTGLLLDMGRRVSVSRVRVVLGPLTGADIQLKIADHATSLDDFAVAAAADDVGGHVTLRPASHHRGRYVLIWFTRLPPQGDGSGVFQADIYEVAVHGR